jgi:uncharacterized cupredoxin-like copper-binding protein
MLNRDQDIATSSSRQEFGMRYVGSLFLPVAATVLLASGCGTGHLSGSQNVGVTVGASSRSQQVAVTLEEYELKVTQKSVSSGKVSFKVHNAGRDKHEFVILRTDIPPAGLLTMGSQDKVNEAAPGVVHVAEIDGVDPGKERDLDVELKPGNYVLICNIVGHVHEGMVAGFVVR